MKFADGSQSYDIIDPQFQKLKISACTFFWVLKENDISEAHFFLGCSDENPFHRGVTNDGAYTPDGKYWDDNFAADEIKNGSTYLDGVLVNGINDTFTYQISNGIEKSSAVVTLKTESV